MVYVFQLLLLWAALLLVFAAQKPLFMLANLGYAEGLTIGDWAAVVWHGLRLDVPMACLLLATPIVLAGVRLFVPGMNLRRALTVYFVPLSLLLSLIFVADAALYGFWGAKLDAVDLMYAHHPKDMFASLTAGYAAVGLLAVAAAAAAIFALLRAAAVRRLPPTRRWTTLAALTLMLGGCFVGFRGGTGPSPANPGYVFFSSNRFLNHAALNPAFNMTYSLFRRESLGEEFQSLAPAEAERIAADIYAPHADLADTLLRCRRPDIVLVIWEGGGWNMACNDTVAPFYGRLRREGVCFDSLYANGHRTDRGLVSLLSGWPSLPNHSLMNRADLCPGLPSLARSLAREGYATEFCYGGDADFTNMRGYLFETGFARIRSGADYRGAAVRNNWGIADEYLLRPDPQPLPSPSFQVLLTLSSHESWEVPYSRLADERENAFAYTDSCLYAFVRRLQHSPRWDSLLVIVVPDHGVAATGGYPYTPEVAHIPMLWIGGAVLRPATVSALMNQSDLAATLLAQMGLPFGDFPFSRNVLSRHRQRPVAAHCFKNGLNLIAGGSTSSYECVDGRLLPIGGDTCAATQTLARALLQQYYSRSAALGR